MSTDDGEEQEQDALDWIRAHPERVEALAETDAPAAVDAQAVLGYLDGEDGDETERYDNHRVRALMRSQARSTAEEHARRVRDALTGKTETVEVSR